MYMRTVPFWAQIHGLPVRAMNKKVDEEVGALLGAVVEVSCDADGNAIGRCTCMRVLLDIHSPII